MIKKKKDKLSKLDKELLKIEWRDIYLGKNQTSYQVSNNGFVKNRETNKLLSPGKTQRGYLMVNIYLNGKMYTRSVHRLVARAFIPNPESKRTVNHKDGNKENNYDWNLEWATYKENTQHAIQNKLWNPRHGNQVGGKSTGRKPKYEIWKIHEICKLLEQGYGNAAISKSLDINKKTIEAIKGKTKWIHISSKYNIPPTKKRIV